MESKDLIEQLNYADECRYIEAKRGRSIDLGTQHATVALTLTDASGKQVGSATYTNAQKVAYTVLQPAGVYFMTLTAADQRAVIRLVRE